MLWQFKFKIQYLVIIDNYLVRATPSADERQSANVESGDECVSWDRYWEENKAIR